MSFAFKETSKTITREILTTCSIIDATDGKTAFLLAKKNPLKQAETPIGTSEKDRIFTEGIALVSPIKMVEIGEEKA